MTEENEGTPPTNAGLTAEDIDKRVEERVKAIMAANPNSAPASTPSPNQVPASTPSSSSGGNSSGDIGSAINRALDERESKSQTGYKFNELEARLKKVERRRAWWNPFSMFE